MKNRIITTLILLAALTACKDNYTGFDPRDAGNIEGIWNAQSGGNTVWTMQFSDGHAVHRVIDFGQTLVNIEFAYRISGDTIYMDRLFSNSQTWDRVWVVKFGDENNCVARDIMQPDSMPVIVLWRIP